MKLIESQTSRTVRVPKATTVAALKRLAYAEQLDRGARVTFVFRGARMEDEYPLSYYPYELGATFNIHCVVGAASPGGGGAAAAAGGPRAAAGVGVDGGASPVSVTTATNLGVAGVALAGFWYLLVAHGAALVSGMSVLLLFFLTGLYGAAFWLLLVVPLLPRLQQLQRQSVPGGGGARRAHVD